MSWIARWPSMGSRRGCPRCKRPGRAHRRRYWPRPRSRGRRIGRMPGMASAASTASIWATCSPRCSTCSAPIRVRAGECRRRRARDRDERRASTAAWRALAAVEDPEIPALSIVDLGLIRFVDAASDGTLEVGLSPTYVGCPATEVIRRSVEEALRRRAVGALCGDRRCCRRPGAAIGSRAEGRRKLEMYGIVPPRALRLVHARCAAHEPADRPARAATRPTPNASASLVRPRARRCIAAAPASNPSNTSSASDMAACLSFIRLKVAAVERVAEDADLRDARGSARRCAKPLRFTRASTSPCGARSRIARSAAPIPS